MKDRPESLSDYISLLQKYPSTNYAFRGENALFNKRLAGAFRGKTECLSSTITEDGAIRNEGTLEGCSSNDSALTAIDDYYSQVSHRISDIEKENFIAFAQHHWLPTNLIDITSAPLVALFMACYEAKSEGYVYIFDKSYFIDITKIISMFPRESILDVFSAGKTEVVVEILQLTQKHFMTIQRTNKDVVLITTISFDN